MTTEPPSFAAATIVARNYLAQARVLATSFARHHPGRDFVVLVIDDPHPASSFASEPFELLGPNDLSLAPADLLELAAIYSAKELATALKPWLLTALLDRGNEVVVYLDPDLDVHGPLTDAVRLADEHGIVLTPHTTAPIPLDGRSPTELELQSTGIYNLGFLAVGGAARPFLDWWGERLWRECIIETKAGLFVDQRWADWVPSYFPHVILRDPGYNVAHWNLHERSVQVDAGRYTVSGAPLRFFHFSGFDPERPYLLTGYGYRNPPRILLGEGSALERMCADYAGRLLAAGYREQRAVAYGHGVATDGGALDGRTRTLYRSALMASEREGTEAPPNPLAAGSARAFAAWRRAGADGRLAPAADRAVAHVETLENLAAQPPRALSRRLASWLFGPRLSEQVHANRALLDALGDTDRRITALNSDLDARLRALERRLPPNASERDAD